MASGPFASPSTSIYVNASISFLNAFIEPMTFVTVLFTALSERSAEMDADVLKSDFNSSSTPSITSEIIFLVRETVTPSKLNEAFLESWLKLLVLE